MEWTYLGLITERWLVVLIAYVGTGIAAAITAWVLYVLAIIYIRPVRHWAENKETRRDRNERILRERVERAA